MHKTNTLKNSAQQFALAYGVDASSVECALAGVLSRIESAQSKGAALSEGLIEAAFIDWFKSQELYYQNLLENKNGAMDDLRADVYAKLKAI